MVARKGGGEGDRVFEGSEAEILAGGHAHMQVFRRYKDAMLLNPGSVGLAIDRISPFEEIRNAPWAEYAILSAEDSSLSVELYRIPFDLQAVIQAVLSSRMPHAEWWTSEWSSI